jgi:hypothetical protein
MFESGSEPVSFFTKGKSFYMSNEIATIKSEFPVLDGSSREAMILASKFQGEPLRESDLSTVRTPSGGSTTFTWTNQVGQSQSAAEIKGVLVANAGRGTLWPTREPSGSKPLITTHDLSVGYQTGEDYGDIDASVLERYLREDGSYDWAAMSNSPDFGFGSAGRGKRVKESHVLAILQPGEILPVLVQLGTASLAAWGRFAKALSVLPHEAVVAVTLEKAKNMGGQPFSRMKFALAGTLTPDEGSVVYDLYTKPLDAVLKRKPYTVTPAAY